MSDIIKPDFEKLAGQEMSRYGVPTRQPFALQQGYIAGCEKIWTDHVEPLLSTVKRLQEENEQLKYGNSSDRVWGALHDKINDLQRELELYSKSLESKRQENTLLQEEKKELVDFIKELANDYHDRVSPGFKYKAKELLKSSELNK